MSLLGFLSLTNGKGCQMVSSATIVCEKKHQLVYSENIHFLTAGSALLLYKELAYKDGPIG